MTTIFLFSMFAICAIIASKVFEMKVRKIHFLSKTFKAGDTFIHKWLEVIKSKYSRVRTIVQIFIFDFLPSYLYEILIKMKDYVAKKYYEAGDEFRGRRILRKGGSVSFFLEKLTEEKSEIDSREI